MNIDEQHYHELIHVRDVDCPALNSKLERISMLSEHAYRRSKKSESTNESLSILENFLAEVQFTLATDI